MNYQPEQEEYQDEYWVEESIEEPTSSPLAELQMPFWLKISLLLLVILLLLLVSWWSSGNPFRGTQAVPLEPLAPQSESRNAAAPFSPARSQVIPAAEVSRYYSNRINVSFSLPPGWREIQMADSELPLGVRDIAVALYNSTMNCVIAAGTFDQRAADYVQTSFGGRVESAVTQFDGSWFTNQAYHEENIFFSDQRRQFLAQELRHTYNLDTADFVLWERSGASVPQSCDSDFVSLLQSIEHHYLPIELEVYDVGDITTRTLISPNELRSAKLLFTDTIDGNTYELADISAHGSVSRVFVVGTRLYFDGVQRDDLGAAVLPGERTFSVFNTESNQLEFIERPAVDQNPLVASTYVTADSLYYLSGPTSSLPCVDGPQQGCELQLYRLPLADPSAYELLATSTAATYIIGYAKDQEALFLQSGYGDAGCVWSTIYVHANKFTHTAATYGGCVGEAGYAEYEREMMGLMRQVNDVTARAVRFERGAFTASAFSPPGFSSTFVVVTD